MLNSCFANRQARSLCIETCVTPVASGNGPEGTWDRELFAARAWHEYARRVAASGARRDCLLLFALRSPPTRCSSPSFRIDLGNGARQVVASRTLGFLPTIGPVSQLAVVSNQQERSPLTNDAVSITTFNLPFIVATILARLDLCEPTHV
jgi:hypothetical protein